MTAEGAIERLNDATVSAIRSGINIPSLPSVLLELVQNSLDAGASRVDCSVDLSRWLIKCDDNGHGMSLSDLERIERYASSKTGSAVTTFGFRGEALASLADVGLLEIITRQGSHTYSLIFRDGVRLSLALLPDNIRRGTVVTVRDIFFKWPVRRKNLEATSSRSALLNSLRDSLGRIALVKPDTAFTLTNIEGAPRRLLSVSASRDGIVGRWAQLFGRAEVAGVHPVSASRSLVSIKGFISQTAAHSKAHQFIYVNSRPVSLQSMHKMVNESFARSRFPQHAPVATDEPVKSKRSTTAERYPVYQFDIIVDASKVDVTLDPQKVHVELADETTVTTLLREAVTDFLVKEGYSSRLEPACQSEAFASQTKLPFSSSKAHQSPHRIKKRPRTEATETPCVAPVADDETDTEPVKWTDPTTHRVYFIDPRSGHSWPVKPDSMAPDEVDGDAPSRSAPSTDLVDRGRLCKSHADLVQDTPSWLSDIVATWQNPTFAPAAKRVKSVDALQSTLGLESSERTRPVDGGQKLTKASLKQAQFIRQVDDKFLLVKTPNAALAADDDGQEGRSATVLLIDQHAADERVRVERFFAELCSEVSTLTFDEPISVLLTRHEHTRLLEPGTIESFSRWGVTFERANSSSADGPEADTNTNDFASIDVLTVPMLVSDRLKDRATLQSFFKSYLAEFESAPRHRATTTATATKPGRPSWLSTIAECPKMLVDLINSKACRGAIMFNDRLTDERARKLITALAETAFPFQCAHARPSLVPLYNVVGRQGSMDERTAIDWDRLK